MDNWFQRDGKLAEAYFTETQGREEELNTTVSSFRSFPYKTLTAHSKDHKQTPASPQVTVCAARFSNGSWLGQPVTSLIRNRKLIRFPGANGFALPLPLAGFAAGLPGPVTVPVKLLGFVFNWNIERIAHIRVV